MKAHLDVWPKPLWETHLLAEHIQRLKSALGTADNKILLGQGPTQDCLLEGAQAKANASGFGKLFGLVCNSMSSIAKIASECGFQLNYVEAVSVIQQYAWALSRFGNISLIISFIPGNPPRFTSIVNAMSQDFSNEASEDEIKEIIVQIIEGYVRQQDNFP